MPESKGLQQLAHESGVRKEGLKRKERSKGPTGKGRAQSGLKGTRYQSENAQRRTRASERNRQRVAANNQRRCLLESKS